MRGLSKHFVVKRNGQHCKTYLDIRRLSINVKDESH